MRSPSVSPDPTSSQAVSSPRRRSGRAFAALFGLGLIGVATLPFVIIALLRTTALPGLGGDLPRPASVALLMIKSRLLPRRWRRAGTPVRAARCGHSILAGAAKSPTQSAARRILSCVSWPGSHLGIRPDGSDRE